MARLINIPVLETYRSTFLGSNIDQFTATSFVHLPTKSIRELEKIVAKMLTIPRIIVEMYGDQEPESEKIDTE